MKPARLLPLVRALLGFLVLAAVGAAPSADAAGLGRPGGVARPVAGGKRVVKTGGDARAWSLLRPLLPAEITIAGEVNVAALRGTDTFRQLRRIIEKGHDYKEALDLMKAGCQIDLAEAVQDVAFAVTDPNQTHLLVAVSFKNLDESDLLRCAEALATSKGGKGAHIESKRSGAIVEYGLAGDHDHAYASWLAPDVVAFVTEPSDRDVLVKLLSGKGGFAAAPATRRAIAAVPAGAVAWAVYLKAEHLDAHEMSMATAGATLGGGQLQLDVSVFMSDADAAKKAAADWMVERDQLAANGRVPTALETLLKAVQFVPTAEVVHITAQTAERDFVGLLSLW
jgi:hypothetical protein